MTKLKTFLSIGECMLELAPANSGDYHLGYAGDTLNTAWYARAGLPTEDWEVAYFTRIGRDPYSKRLRAFLEENGLSTRFISTDPTRRPGLYLIDVKDGERSFTYWRDQSAARLLAEDTGALAAALSEAAVIYFSGITLAILPVEQRAPFLEQVGAARQGGALTVFDPNIRPRLWDAADALRDVTMQAAGVAEIALPSFDDEAQIFGDTDLAATASRYRDAGCDVVVVKNGGGPMLVRDSAQAQLFDAVEKLKPVDTTGAGDSFNGGFLSGLMLGLDLSGAIDRAHRLASQVIMHRGALVPMERIIF